MTPEEAQATGVPPNSLLLPDSEHPGRNVLVHKEVIVSGDDLVNAYAGYDNRAGGIGERAVDFEFNSRGAAAFAKVTRENIGKPFAIILDNKVVSAPVIRSEIPGGRGQITGCPALRARHLARVRMHHGVLLLDRKWPTAKTKVVQRALPSN